MTSSHTIKRGAALAVASALLVTAAGCGGDNSGSESQGETVTLRFSYFTSENNPIGQTWKAWMEEVTERSDGTLTFEEYWDGTLLPADEVVAGLNDGRADIAQVTPTFYPGKFPMTAVNELPFGTDNLGAIASAMLTLSSENDDLAAEWSSQGIKPLAWNVGGPSSIVSTKQIDSAAGFDGLKIRGIDRGSRALDAAGANVVALGPEELYGSLDRGLLDATYGIHFGVVPSLKLQEVGDYVVDAGTGASTASTLAMSEERWNELSAEHQEILTETASLVPELYVEKNSESEEVACAAVNDAGIELTVLPDSEVEKLRAAGEQVVVDEWLKEMDEAGHDGEAFRSEYTDAVQSAATEFPDSEKSGVERCLEGN